MWPVTAKAVAARRGDLWGKNEFNMLLICTGFSRQPTHWLLIQCVFCVYVCAFSNSGIKYCIKIPEKSVIFCIKSRSVKRYRMPLCKFLCWGWGKGRIHRKGD